MLHSVAPRDAARLQVTGYACRGGADTRMGGQKPFESNSRRKAILHACMHVFEYAIPPEWAPHAPEGAPTAARFPRSIRYREHCGAAPCKVG